MKNSICIAICTLNAENFIEVVLKSCVKNLNEDDVLFVVDGNSSDDTVNIAKKYTKHIYFDNGTGLAAARNIALKHCDKDYIFYVGPDNELCENTTSRLIKEMTLNNWIGISATSYYQNSRSYLKKSFNLYKRAKYFPGEKKIIGTPWLYKTSVLKSFNWSEKNRFSDDTDLCQKLNNLGLKVGISNIDSIELGEPDLLDIKSRWKMYGRSDFEFYSYNTKSYTIFKKIRSFNNAIFVDFINPLMSNKINFSNKLYLIPFLIYITFTRYNNFLKLYITKK